MDLRSFCSMQGFDSAICLTYSFDPVFFEHVVLPDLWSGGTNGILVFADARQARESVIRSARQLRYLGRRYCLVPVSTTGAFHPKMLLRIGSEGAAVCIGSGNLTSGGWGGNRELVTAWHVEKNDSSQVAVVDWLSDVLMEYTRDKTALDVLTLIRDRHWLLGTPGAGDSPILLSHKGKSIGQQLMDRWQGRRFRRLCVLTGSTDANGAMIKWAVNTFGISEVLIGLDPQNAGFIPSSLARIGCAVRLIPLSPSPCPHAKLAWFEGPDGYAAVAGSANCSASAWSIAPNSGGNTELVVVYDSCRKEDFSSFLELLEGDSFEPAATPGLGRRREAEEGSDADAEAHDYSLVSLSLNGTIGRLIAVVEPGIPEGAVVYACLGGLELPLDRAGLKGRSWVGPLPDLHPSVTTVFGHLIIHQDTKIQHTDVRWLDEIDELRNSFGARHAASTVRELAKLGTTSEYRRLLEDLARVISTVLGESTSFPDPPAVGSDTEGESQETQEVMPVSPEDLIVSLDEIEERESQKSSTAPGLSLALLGVMRVLFAEPEHVSENVTEGLTTASIDEPIHSSREVGSSRSQDGEKRLPSQDLRKRLCDQMTRFLEKFGGATFCERCTATQMVQGAALPLAVAAVGIEGEWLDTGTASEWAVTVSDILFRTMHTSHEDEPVGLLAKVEVRYDRERRSETYAQVVGDGALWVSLAAAINWIAWDQSGRGLEKALMLREIYSGPQLFARADQRRINLLVSRLHMKDTDRTILLKAKRMTDQLRRLESYLIDNFGSLRALQERKTCCTGDPLWHETGGYGRAAEKSEIVEGGRIDIYRRERAQVVMVKSDFYLNLRLLAEIDPKVRKLLAPFGQCWPSLQE
ncbi:hypothetical protein E3J62_11425 [candidate division TA06 bacterium]|uniref:Phospholipase D-like domain-containing protein n=1 Tax=candidate division TA06 bacterium TaxID=2250710 RepID=A0A523UP03_UNCT6|nr:MAG: hypothetical protein E3J62_11425 [candidate division TA06 bacterium]